MSYDRLRSPNTQIELSVRQREHGFEPSHCEESTIIALIIPETRDACLRFLQSTSVASFPHSLPKIAVSIRCSAFRRRHFSWPFSIFFFFWREGRTEFILRKRNARKADISQYVERPQVEWPGATRLDNTEFDGKINLYTSSGKRKTLASKLSWTSFFLDENIRMT